MVTSWPVIIHLNIKMVLDWFFINMLCYKKKIIIIVHQCCSPCWQIFSCSVPLSIFIIYACFFGGHMMCFINYKTNQEVNWTFSSFPALVIRQSLLMWRQTSSSIFSRLFLKSPFILLFFLTLTHFSTYLSSWPLPSSSKSTFQVSILSPKQPTK